MRLIPKEVPNYEKMNIIDDGKFVLQDADKRNFLLKNKQKKTKIINKSQKNREKYIDKTEGNKVSVRNIAENVSLEDEVYFQMLVLYLMLNWNQIICHNLQLLFIEVQMKQMKL